VKATLDISDARRLLAHANSVDAAFDRLSDKIAHDHFFKITGRKLASMSSIPDLDEATGATWSETLIAALTVVQDEGAYQFSLAMKSSMVSTVYVRTIVEHGPSPFPNLCQPMTADDVQAIVAMVEGGPSGVTALTGMKPGHVVGWTKTGVKSRPDASARLLAEILARYALVGRVLPSEPLTIDAFVKEAVEGRVERIKRIEGMRKAVAEAPVTIPEPEPEPEPVKVEPAQEEIVPVVTTSKRTCAKPACGREIPNDGRRLCFKCEDLMMRESGMGAIEPIAESTWRSEVEMLVTQRLAAKGLDEVEAGLIGEQAHQLEELLQAQDLGLDDAGIYVDGVNLEALEESIRESYAGRAVQANSRRNDGVVLVGGMEMNPLRLREIHDQMDGAVREINNMILRPLMEDMADDAVLRAAFGGARRKQLMLLQARVARLAALVAEAGVELVEEDAFDALEDGS